VEPVQAKEDKAEKYGDGVWGMRRVSGRSVVEWRERKDERNVTGKKEEEGFGVVKKFCPKT